MFSVIGSGGNTVALQIPDVNGEAVYLDAYYPTRVDEGADIWKKGNDSDQQWILEKQSDGTYLIYLAAYPNLYLTNQTANGGDLISLSERKNDRSQNWFAVIKQN